MATNTLRPGLPPLPPQLAHLPIDARGFPVPYFVYRNAAGVPDHRIADKQKIISCISRSLCWICGKPTKGDMVLSVGPLSAVTRSSSEPPSHMECARYACMACPFLSKPHAKRRGNDIPVEADNAPGHIERNPGVIVLWKTRRVKYFSQPRIFKFGEAEHIEIYAEGRPATLEELFASIDSGMPSLYAQCENAADIAMANLARDEAKRLFTEVINDNERSNT